RGELVSCFLIQMTDDMNSIGRNINSALQLSRIGGGVGINLSNLRGAGAPIKGIHGAASGVVPVMKLLEDSFTYSNQLGQRQGAGAVYLNVFLPDIESFLYFKNINSALQLSRIGGGVGINLSNLRGAGAPIKGIHGAASGVVPVMKLLEDSFTYSNQLGQRQGAGAVYLNVFHPDIEAFLSAKKENADEKIR